MRAGEERWSCVSGWSFLIGFRSIPRRKTHKTDGSRATERNSRRHTTWPQSDSSKWFGKDTPPGESNGPLGSTFKTPDSKSRFEAG